MQVTILKSQIPIEVKAYHHPEEGLLWATLVDKKIVSVIGQNGPVRFAQYEDPKYLNIGNYVADVSENVNVWIPRQA